MLWRLIFVLGAAAIGYGCSRKNEGSGETPARSIPAPPPPPTQPRTPLIPPEFSSTFTPDPARPGVLPRTPARVDCSRFASPSAVLNVVNARLEHERLQGVMPHVNRHIREMQAGNFEGVQNDPNVTNALVALQGISIYLQDGVPNILDTESDWHNLNAALSYLNNLGGLRVNPQSPNDEASRAARAWASGGLTIQFRAFLFMDEEVPHGLRQNSTAAPSTDALFLRIVTPTNSGNERSFPVLKTCNVDRQNVTTVDGY